VLLLPSGHHGQVLAFTPPFVVSHDEVGTMLELLGEAFAEELGAP
jgi:4-aminobutyrate aminotransferase-like enzyme